MAGRTIEVEEKEEKRKMPFTLQNTADSRHNLFASTGLSVSD
jgi:hypothetical protein